MLRPRGKRNPKVSFEQYVAWAHDSLALSGISNNNVGPVHEPAKPHVELRATAFAWL